MKTNIEKVLLLFIILIFISFSAPIVQAQTDDSPNTKFKDVCKQWQKKYTNGVQNHAPHTTEDYGGDNGWVESCRLTDQSFTLRKTIGDRDITLNGIDVNIFYGSRGEDLRNQSYKVDVQKYYQSIKAQVKLAELIEIPNGSIVMRKARSQINPEIIYTEGARLFQDKAQCSLEMGTLESWNLKDYPPDKDPFWKIDRNNQAGQIEFIRSVADNILNNPICTEKTNLIPLKNAEPVQSNYNQALVIEQPKESDFQKVSKSDFKQVYPAGTASASITGSIFIGKIGGEGELILQLPNGKEVKLTDDKSAFEGEKPYARWRDISGRNDYIAPKRSVYIKEIDCQIQLEQERRNQEMIKSLGGIRYASEWGVDETIIVKPTGDCSYTNEGGPVRMLAGLGQVTFKTPGGVAVSAENADFGIGYNAKSFISIFEVYNGSITVTNNTGDSKTISAIYGSKIKQIEVNKDGLMSEKIAIPQSQWQTFLASNQKSEKETAAENNLPIVPAVTVLAIGGLIFFLYRTGRLLPFYKISSQKIAEILKKFSKKND